MLKKSEQELIRFADIWASVHMLISVSTIVAGIIVLAMVVYSRLTQGFWPGYWPISLVLFIVGAIFVVVAVKKLDILMRYVDK